MVSASSSKDRREKKGRVKLITRPLVIFSN